MVMPPDIYDATLIFMTFSGWQFGCPLKWTPPDTDSDSHYAQDMIGLSQYIPKEKAKSTEANKPITFWW